MPPKGTAKSKAVNASRAPSAHRGRVHNKLLNDSNRLLSLPAELTAAILLYCHGADIGGHQEMGWGSVGRRPVEIIISHVCQHWRQTALGLQTLWTRFHFVEVDESYETLENVLQLYEERCPGGLEDIHLSLLGYYSSIMEESVQGILAKHRNSIRRFALFAGDEFQLFSLILNCLGSFSAPNLEYLAISPGDYYEEEEPDEEVVGFKPRGLCSGKNPKLKFYFCNDICTWYGMPPTANLTTLRIEGDGTARHTTTLSAFHSLLSFPKLANLSLRNPLLLAEGETWPSNFPVTMKSLRNLRLEANGSLFDAVIHHIRAPQLEFVTLKNFTYQLPSSTKAAFPKVHDLIFIDSDALLTPAGSLFATLFPNVVTLTIASVKPKFWLNRLPDDTKSAFSTWTSLQRVAIDVAHSFDLYLEVWIEERQSRFCVEVGKTSLSLWKKKHGNSPMPVDGSGAYYRLDYTPKMPALPKFWPQNEQDCVGFVPFDPFYGHLGPVTRCR